MYTQPGLYNPNISLYYKSIYGNFPKVAGSYMGFIENQWHNEIYIMGFNEGLKGFIYIDGIPVVPHKEHKAVAEVSQ